MTVGRCRGNRSPSTTHDRSVCSLSLLNKECKDNSGGEIAIVSGIYFGRGPGTKEVPVSKETNNISKKPYCRA